MVICNPHNVYSKSSSVYYCVHSSGGGVCCSSSDHDSPLFNQFPLIFTSTCLNPFRFYFCLALFWSWQGHSSLWIPNHAPHVPASLSLSLALSLCPSPLVSDSLSLLMHASWFHCLLWQIRSHSTESLMRKTCFEPQTNPHASFRE